MLACRQWVLGRQCDCTMGSRGGRITLLPPPRTYVSAVELLPCQAKLCRAGPIGVGPWWQHIVLNQTGSFELICAWPS